MEQELSIDSIDVEEQIARDKELSAFSGQVFADALIEPDTTFDLSLIQIVTYWKMYINCFLFYSTPSVF